MDRLFAPQSIAIIGISSRPDNLEYPIFRKIGDALRALAASRDWHRRRMLNVQRSMPKAREAHHASRTTSHPLPESPTLDEALRLVDVYGVPTAAWAVARDADEALQAGERLGYPLAVKVISAQISHKTDVGGVALDVADGTALHQA